MYNSIKRKTKKGGKTMLKVKKNKYTRIRKDEARRLYSDGETVYILPCKVYPDDNHPWIKPFKMDFRTFDEFVNEYEYYNCNIAELGYYAAFYIKEA